MAWRKRATPAPAFKQPSPFDPSSGQFAPIGKPKIHARATMFQVNEDDTHNDYVVCQGWDLDTDPDCQYLIKSIPVAKPFGMRGTFPYKVADVVAAIKVRTVLGDNCGTASVSDAQPADLDEDIILLTDDDNTPINWLLIDSPPQLFPFELYDDITPSGTDVLAWPLKDDLTRDNSTSPPTMTVNDEITENNRGYGSNHSWCGGSSTSNHGVRGWYMIGSNSNQIVTMQQYAQLILVTVGGACVAGGATFTPTAVTVLDRGQDPSNGGACFTDATYKNWQFAMCAGATGVVMSWNEATESYIVISAPRLPMTIVGTAPSTVAAGGTFTYSGCGSPTIQNWNQTLCSGANFTAILTSDGCSPTYTVIDGDCPTAGC